MAFAGSVSIPTGANLLPLISDLSGNNPDHGKFSHLQLVVGGTVVFGSNPTVTITGIAGDVLAIPAASRLVTLGSSATALLGSSRG